MSLGYCGGEYSYSAHWKSVAEVEAEQAAAEAAKKTAEEAAAAEEAAKRRPFEEKGGWCYDMHQSDWGPASSWLPVVPMDRPKTRTAQAVEVFKIYLDTRAFEDIGMEHPDDSVYEAVSKAVGEVFAYIAKADLVSAKECLNCAIARMAHVPC